MSSVRLPLAIIGGGPAGLMAAERLAESGLPVHLFEAKPAPARKLLVAGHGGLNLTHSEPFEDFVSRYGDEAPLVRRWLETFSPGDLRQWVHGLGIPTFVGTSGRVFPQDGKALPLLQRWLERLERLGVQMHLRHRWQGWDENGGLRFITPQGMVAVEAQATLLALGGASWPKTGSDGSWVPILKARGVPIAPLRPANCGFEAAWSEWLQRRFAGTPLKTVTLHLPWDGWQRRGECVLTAYGLEGSLIYAASRSIREQIAIRGSAEIHLDLLPDLPTAAIRERLQRPRGKRSWSEHLRRRLGLPPVKIALLRESCPEAPKRSPEELAERLKALPIRLLRPRPITEAISTAGGVRLDALTEDLMLKKLPGVFCAGEMLDWEAPTGGYLLTACFASGVVAASGILRWLESTQK